MSRSRLCLLVILLGLGLAAPRAVPGGRAATLPQEQPMSFTVEGKISRLEPKKITLSTEENMLFHVLYDDKTEIRRKDGSAGTATDLRVGSVIHVEGDLSESGEILAHRIAIQEEPAKH